MKTLRYGIEIETVGLSREAVAKAIATVVGGTVRQEYGYDPTWTVTDATGRQWKAMPDASLSGAVNAEIVSPILTYADLEQLQQVVRAVKRAGAKVDATCGIHVHVDAAAFDAKKLCNLAKLVNQQEDLLIAALKVQPARLMRYTKRVDAGFLSRIQAHPPRTMAELGAAWYGRPVAARPAHYDDSRYHGLNLHSVWYRGTIEYRYFEATLHAGKVKSYVQLCLALTAKALGSRFALARKRTVDGAHSKYDFRVFLLRLGLIGDEFRTARLHLLENLGGSTAFRNSARPARPTAPSAPDAGASE
jgi:hypothetical protein